MLDTTSDEVQRMRPQQSRFTWHLTLSVVLLLATGCSTIGDVPPALRVDQGEYPANQDEQVRFRTTYYFRIIDSCRVQDGKQSNDYEPRLGLFQVRQTGKLKIVSDSLYRFRMTGKASALFAAVHFESGVLRAEQIDPFGSQVALDPDSNTFRVISANTMRSHDRRETIRQEIKQLASLKKELDEVTNQKLIATLIDNQIKLLGHENDSGVPGADNQHGETDATPNQLCLDGRPLQRGYFLYGPEGVRRLDPDERLLMAMASDSTPLINMLQQLSAKTLQTQPSPDSMFKDVIAEQVSVADAWQELDQTIAPTAATKPEMKALFDRIITRFTDRRSGSSRR